MRLKWPSLGRNAVRAVDVVPTAVESDAEALTDATVPSSAGAFLDTRDDWHVRNSWLEPFCDKSSWRHRNRNKVTRIERLTDAQLQNAYDLSSTMVQHASRHDAVLAECKRRGLELLTEDD